MLKPLLACLTLAALPAAALAQPPAPGQWTVSGTAEGCIAHTNLPQGSVLSLLAGAGQENLLILIQNKEWSSLEDGQRHKVAVQLDGRSPWQFDAVARTELDSDGPGLLFAVPPGDQDGVKFISELAAAAGMNVGQDGQELEAVRLSGGSSAMADLAKCMSRLWGGSAAVDAGSTGATAASAGVEL